MFSAELTLSIETRPYRRSWVVRTLLTIAPVIAYLFILSYVPLPSAISSSSGTSALISRLTVIGTVILGTLSGFGSINNAWQFLPLSNKTSRMPTDGDVTSSENALARIRDDLVERRKQLQRLESSQTKNETWLSKVAVNFRGNTGTSHFTVAVTTSCHFSELSSVALELTGLEALEFQMARNLDSLRQRRDEGRFAGTATGRLLGVGGRLFAVYCVFRIISVGHLLQFILPSLSICSPS